MTSANEIEAQKSLINNAFKKWINPLLITPQYTDLQKKNIHGRTVIIQLYTTQCNNTKD